MLGQKSLKKFRCVFGQNDDIKKSFWMAYGIQDLEYTVS